jgi:hypothetical protein
MNSFPDVILEPPPPPIAYTEPQVILVGEGFALRNQRNRERPCDILLHGFIATRNPPTSRRIRMDRAQNITFFLSLSSLDYCTVALIVGWLGGFCLGRRDIAVAADPFYNA